MVIGKKCLKSGDDSILANKTKILLDLSDTETIGYRDRRDVSFGAETTQRSRLC